MVKKQVQVKAGSILIFEISEIPMHCSHRVFGGIRMQTVAEMWHKYPGLWVTWILHSSSSSISSSCVAFGTGNEFSVIALAICLFPKY